MFVTTRFGLSALAVLLVFPACRSVKVESCPEEQKSLALNESGQLASSRDLLASSWMTASGDCRWRLKTLLADVYVLLRRSKEALTLLHAEPLPKDASPAVRYRFHLARGYAELSPQDLTEAARIAAQARNPRWEVDALIRLANVEARGKPEQAEARFGQAVAVAERHGDERAAADAYAAQGGFLFRQERLGQAEQVLQRALALADRLDLPLVAMRCRGNLGFTYLRWGDHARALDLITRAEGSARQYGQTLDQIRLLQNLGNIQYALGQSAVARNYLEQSLQLAQAAGERSIEAVILYNLLTAYIDAGELDKAEQSAEGSYRLRVSLKESTAEPFYRLSQARILRARGDFAGAASLLRALIRAGGMLAWFSWSVHAELAAVEERRGNDVEAAAHYEKAISIMHGAKGDISKASAQFSFISENIGLHQQYIRFLASRGKAEPALRASDWGRVAMASGHMPAFTVERIRRVCRERQEILIAFSLGSRQSYGWIVTPVRFQMVELPGEASIRAAVERWEREMDSPQHETVAAAALYDMLFQPLLRPGELSGAVAFAPDGILHRVNPEALVVDGKFWIEHASAVRISSIVGFAGNPPPRDIRGKLLIIGAPVYPVKELPDLPGATEEISAISKHFQATVLRGAKATPEAYVEARPENFGYIHFATHGIGGGFDPMESSLVLSQGRSGYQLTARKIATHRIQAKLVTLASCRSAGERVSTGGLLGLGFAFLQAGAESVLASLWDVDDETAVVFAKKLYEALETGQSVERSARLAKLAVMHGGASRTPRRWSAWVLLTAYAAGEP